MESINTSQNNNNAVHLFVLGTGRSGTQSIAALLDNLPDCCVPHEKNPLLLQEGVDFLTGRMSQQSMVDLLHETRSIKELGGKRLSGESNLRLSFLLPAIAEAFPDARYIWMLRDGRSTVSSYFHRKYYHPEYRFKEWELQADEIGEMSTKEWNRLDPFARICWFWSYTNRTIQQQMVQLELNTYLCKLEHFDNELLNIFSFLGLKDKAPQRAPKVDASSNYKLPWHYWSPNQRAVFKDLAGSVMDEHYPGWQEEMNVAIDQEVSAFFHRNSSRFSSFLRSTTRPLRIKLGLKKK